MSGTVPDLHRQQRDRMKYRVKVDTDDDIMKVSPDIADLASVARWLQELPPDRARHIDVERIPETVGEQWVLDMEECPDCRHSGGGTAPCKNHAKGPDFG